MSNIVKCAECGTLFNQADWWNCTECGAASPDLRAERVKESKRRHPSNHQPSTAALDELLRLDQ